MNKLYIIKSKIISAQLDKMLAIFTKATDCIIIEDIINLPDLRGQRILFAMELNETGFCVDVFSILNELYKQGDTSLKDSIGAVLVHSNSDLYTKSSSSNLIFIANNLGCSFLGHPLVEATGSLQNFITWQKTLSLTLEEICIEQCKKLCMRLLDEIPTKFEKPKILALHASSRKTSNTLSLWSMIKTNIIGSDCDIEELNVENGTIHDCTGCSFTTCIHYSKQNSCFYGGFMVKEIVPAIEKADAIVMICPNYNDAISANLTAVINRTTALYRKMSFHEKYIFSIVVSGNSGGDSVARQLIDALNINKGFTLPSYSSIMATANDPGSIKSIPNIEELSLNYSKNLINQIKK
jgi:multimeric flavodoxin WrbA